MKIVVSVVDMRGCNGSVNPDMLCQANQTQTDQTLKKLPHCSQKQVDLKHDLSRQPLHLRPY